ncbi:hypothetical protein [Marininema halotolerans]|uniref:Uncharacterized protein n=1 Tax=Marininema halotolerans TaxID=1155944 RepID=A0A1I6ULV1_9BACL|nr:hypothetical protein [Marininema halotolerans]SFT02422.1 hypothetical protein SAMN05444972_11814 [Marininema halotolerans]
MNERFLKWIKSDANEFFSSIPISEVEAPVGPNDSYTRMTNVTDRFTGKVSVKNNGNFELEVQDSEGKMVLFEHHEIDDTASFEQLLSRYKELLSQGQISGTPQTLQYMRYHRYTNSRR